MAITPRTAQVQPLHDPQTHFSEWKVTLMGIEYLSHEWYVRAVDRLQKELVSAEHYRDDVERRNWMLVDYLATHGVPLDETGMRERYEGDLAHRLLVDNDADRLEDFRRNTVMVVHDAREARGKVTDTELLDAVLKTLDRSLKSCAKKDMSAAEARERAAKATASIPRDVPHDHAA